MERHKDGKAGQGMQREKGRKGHQQNIACILMCTGVKEN